MVTMDHPPEVDHCKSNGYMTDDVALLQKVEAVTPYFYARKQVLL